MCNEVDQLLLVVAYIYYSVVAVIASGLLASWWVWCGPVIGWKHHLTGESKHVRK